MTIAGLSRSQSPDVARATRQQVFGPTTHEHRREPEAPVRRDDADVRDDRRARVPRRHDHADERSVLGVRELPPLESVFHLPIATEVRPRRRERRLLVHVPGDP